MNKNKQIQNHWMRFKVSTLTASITSLILAGLPAQIQASDIDIYQAGGTGTTKIYLMLDVSGSMGDMSLATDYAYEYAYDRRNDYYYDTAKICVESKIPEDLRTSTYVYAKKNSDVYCQVDLSKNKVKNDTVYKNKIKDTCTATADSNVYNCYTRITNLRKGLIDVIADSTIGKDIQFGLSTYSGNAITDKTNFIAMDPATSNKATLIGYVQGITAGGGTPIATAYNRAGKKFTSQSGNSNTSQECTGNGLYFLTDGEPQGDTSYKIDYDGITEVDQEI